MGREGISKECLIGKGREAFQLDLNIIIMLMEWYTGIKEYSEWPTIPQLYVDKEFVGGCDILVAMHQNGELAKMLEEKKVLVPADGETPKSD